MLQAHCMFILFASWFGLTAIICLVLCRAAARPLPPLEDELPLNPKYAQKEGTSFCQAQSVPALEHERVGA